MEAAFDRCLKCGSEEVVSASSYSFRCEDCGHRWITDALGVLICEIPVGDEMSDIEDDDPEPDINDEKSHRDWRMRQGEGYDPREDR